MRLGCQNLHCSVTCVSYRKGSLVPKQEEESLAFRSHSCTQGLFLPDVTVVLSSETEVIACSITSPNENTRKSLTVLET